MTQRNKYPNIAGKTYRTSTGAIVRIWGACLPKTPEENHRNIQRAWQVADQICERADIRYAQQTERAADSSHPVSDLRSAKGRLAGSDCSHIAPRSQHRAYSGDGRIIRGKGFSPD